MEEIEIKITGRVQLVMYRDFAQRKARALKLVGFVKNNTDKTVTVVAQGEKNALRQFVEFLKKGSFLSRVDQVSVSPRLQTGVYSDFVIRY